MTNTVESIVNVKFDGSVSRPDRPDRFEKFNRSGRRESGRRESGET